MSRPLRVAVLPFALSLLAPACGVPGQVGDGDGLGDGDGSGDGDGDGSGDGSGDGDTACEQVSAVEFTPGDPPDVLLVVDRSGSMEDDLETGDEKWPVMTDALAAVVNTYEQSVKFGLMMFPTDDECGAGNVSAGVAMQNAGSINAQLDNTGPGGGTPTHTTMTAARSYYAGQAANPAGRYVLLATDGEPNCEDPNDPENDNPTVTQSIAAIQALTGDGIPTFVLGFGGQVNNYPATLQSMATAGGTGDYFAANSPDELSQALDAIAAEVGLPSCSFRLDATPDDPSAIGVSQDGAQVPQDPSHNNGWDYDAGTNTVSFYGEACEAIRQGEIAEVRIGLGCPGNVVD